MERTIDYDPAAAKLKYIFVEYASSKRSTKDQQGDRLFVPMDQLDQVTKYTGGESPTVTKWAAPTGPAPKAGPVRRSKKSPGRPFSRIRRARPRAGLNSAPDPPCSLRGEGSGRRTG